MLLQLFEKADGSVVTAAELPIDLLHLLPVLIRELQDSNKCFTVLKYISQASVLLLEYFFLPTFGHKHLCVLLLPMEKQHVAADPLLFQRRLEAGPFELCSCVV